MGYLLLLIPVFFVGLCYVAARVDKDIENAEAEQ